MPGKPATAAGYRPEQTTRVRSMLLYVATKIGDLLDDVVVVGGLVPSLLIDATSSAHLPDPHVGTLDLDLGLTLALLSSGRYTMLAERLRAAGFHQDVNDRGRPTRQRWILGSDTAIALDFLIQPSREEDRGGQLRNLEPDFAAIIAPGLHLAFQDRQRVRIAGMTSRGESAQREVWVCGAGAFVVLKALAFRLRGENKDAYDLYYVIRNFGSAPQDVVDRFLTIAPDHDAVRALAWLREDFAGIDGLGPRRVAEFLTGGPDAEVQGDSLAFVSRFVAAASPR